MLRITWLIPGIYAVLCSAIYAQSGDPWADDLGIQHRYSFTDDFSDSVGNAHGTALGGVRIFDGQADFDGFFDSIVELPPSGPDGINVNTYSEITIEIWATPIGSAMGPFPGGDFTGTVLFGNVHPTNPAFSSEYFILSTHRGDDVSRGSISLSTDNSPWTEESGANGPELNDNLEHHYAVTIDQGAITLYVDGVLTEETPLSPTNFLSGVGTEQALLGAGYPQDLTWVGSINEIRIFEQALTEAHVLDSFNAGPDSFPIANPSLDFNNDGTVSLIDFCYIPQNAQAVQNRDALLEQLGIQNTDFDGNGWVDAADLANLIADFTSGAGVDYKSGDADLDGEVTNNDFVLWADNKFLTSDTYSGDEYPQDVEHTIIHNVQTGTYSFSFVDPLDEQSDIWRLADDVFGVQVTDPLGQLQVSPEDLDIEDGNVKLSTPELFITIEDGQPLEPFGLLPPGQETPEGLTILLLDQDGNPYFGGEVRSVDGDFNGDWKVDQDDRQVWESQYENGSEAASGSGFLNWQLGNGFELVLDGELPLQVVPEPTTLAMLTLMLLCPSACLGVRLKRSSE